MQVPVSEVEKIAMLSRLSFKEDEIKQYQMHLEAILQTAQRLSQLDTQNVPPTAHIQGIENVLRDDCPKPSMDNALLTRGAPESDNGCFIVPKVVE